MAFEILTANGQRFRCETSKYRWQYALLPGSLDIEDKTIVEVFRIDDENCEEVTVTFSQVIATGDVDSVTTLIMPTEKRASICPRCGFMEFKK